MAKQNEMKDHTPGKLSRRTFLRSASLATTAALALPGSLSPFSIFIRRAGAQQAPLDTASVVVVRDLAAHQGSQIVPGIVQVMMDEAIRRCTGIADLGEAYKSLFPNIAVGSVIGVKVNCINVSLPTHPAVVTALTNGLQKMTFGGNPFPANNILIWDRTNSELQAAGYSINVGTTGVRCFGTNAVGYNSSVTLSCAGYPQNPSRILTDEIDYLINFAVLKNATGCGLTMTLKNLFGAINSPSTMHGTMCNPYIPATNQQIRDELEVVEALFIVDGIFGTYTGGPMGPPNLFYDGIILGQDRVAVDTIGREILEEYNCPTLANSVHVDTAAQAPYNLGTNNLAEIHRLDVMNPSAPVQNLRVKPRDHSIYLEWSSPEYSGNFCVLRSPDPGFSNFHEIAQVRNTSFIDRGALGAVEKFFYRVVKTW